jgi:hypothetical protein
MGIMAGLAMIGLVVNTSSGAMEARLLARVDPDNTGEESPIAGLAGIGYLPQDNLTVGVYGSFQTTDRNLPRKMRRMYGAGAYLEYDLTVGYRLMPFVGASVGMIDTTGPAYPTALHLVGTFGVKYALQDSLCLSLSINGHWASEDLFDYKTDGVNWDANPYDITMDAGVRFLF